MRFSHELVLDEEAQWCLGNVLYAALDVLNQMSADPELGACGRVLYEPPWGEEETVCVQDGIRNILEALKREPPENELERTMSASSSMQIPGEH
jgi:hypothetical protein